MEVGASNDCGGGGPSGNNTRRPRIKRGRKRMIPSIFVNPDCIFCAAQCHPKCLVIDGNLKRNKCKVEEDAESGREDPSSSIINDNAKENEFITNQLQAIYIVRDILNVGDKVCAKFLKEFGGDFDPELWFNVCDPCKAEVWECYEREREMNRMIRRVQFLKDNFKRKICQSGVGDGGDGRRSTRRPLAVWRELRKRGIKGFTFTGNEDPPNAVIVDEENAAEESSQPLVEEHGGSDDDDDSQSESASSDEDGPASSCNHKKTYYECEICAAIIRNPTHVVPHQLLHINTDRRNCPVDGCGWWIGNSLKRHVKKWHGGNPPDLTRDDIEIVGISKFNYELEKKSLKKPNPWSQVQYYKKPALSEESSKYFRKCDACGLLFKTKKRLDYHMGEVHPETDTAAATNSSVATNKRASTSSKQQRQRSEGFLPKPNNPSSNAAAAVSSSVVIEKEIASTSSQEQRQDSEVFSPLLNPPSNADDVGHADQLTRKAPVPVLINQTCLLPEAGNSSQISKKHQSSSRPVKNAEKFPDLVSVSGGPPPSPSQEELPILERQGPQSVTQTASTSKNQTEAGTEKQKRKSNFCICSKCNAHVRCTTAAVRGHQKLHEPGGKGKICDIDGCGWVFNSASSSHFKTRHSGSCPSSKYDIIVKMRMEEWLHTQNSSRVLRSRMGKETAASPPEQVDGDDDDDDEKRNLKSKRKLDSHGASTEHDTTSHHEAPNKKWKLWQQEATRDY